MHINKKRHDAHQFPHSKQLTTKRSICQFASWNRLVVFVYEKSIAEQIKELNDLKDQGILSEDEFITAKAKVLA